MPPGVPVLPAVGNDLVDLAEEEVRQGRSSNERFVRRVCSDEERALLEHAADPEILLWTLYAAKEAAYKVVGKLKPGTPFAKQRFVVHQDQSVVRYEQLTLNLWVHTHREYIHALVSTTPSPPFAVVNRIDEKDDPSREVRRLLVTAIASRDDCPAADLSIVRRADETYPGGLAPPCLLCKGYRTGIDVSLSHHGRYVAAAASQAG